MKESFFLGKFLISMSTILLLLACNNTYERPNRGFATVVKVQTSNLGVLPWLPEASIDTQRVFSSAVFGTLLKYNEQMQVLPGIFKDFNWDQKKSEYHFKYDTNMKYHNGEKFHPADIEFAILKLFLTDKKIVRKEIFSDILGVDNLQVGQKFQPGMVKGIRYDMNGNFYIKLKKVNPRFLYSLSISVPGIGPRAAFKKDMFAYKVQPVGLGPYKVVKLDRKKVIIDLERVDPNYCDSNVLCPKYIKMIEAGDPTHNKPDIAMFTAAQHFMEKSEYNIVESSLPTSIMVIDFNFSNKFSKQEDFRKALSMAINRLEICQNYKRLKPSHQLITSKTIGRTDSKFVFDPEGARKIIKKSFPDIKINGWFHGPPDIKAPDYVESIRGQFADIGVQVNFSSTLKHSMESEDIAIFVYSTSFDYSNPSLPLAMNLESNARRMHLPKDRKTIEKMYSVLKKAKSPEAEARAVKRVIAYYMDTYIQLPIGQAYKVMALRRGIEYSKSGSFAYSIDFDNVSVKN